MGVVREVPGGKEVRVRGVPGVAPTMAAATSEFKKVLEVEVAPPFVALLLAARSCRAVVAAAEGRPVEEFPRMPSRLVP